jgi:hypothetical protein
MFVSKAKATYVKHILGASLYGRLLALPKYIRLSWKGLPGTNALTYYKYSKITDKKPHNAGPCTIKHYGFVIYGTITSFVVS